MTEDNLSLWRQVETTPEKYLRDVSLGKRTFKAINAQYQIMRMTELFGPMGLRWGWETSYEIVGKSVGCPTLVAHVALWWRPETGTETAHCRGSGAVRLVRNDVVDIDAWKKCETDAVTKILARLGIGADVHLGLWDDNKYVQEQRSAERQPAPAPQQPAPEAPAVEPPTGTWDPGSINDGYKIKLPGDICEEVRSFDAFWDREIRFGDYKGRPWGDMTEGARDGGRVGFLTWCAITDPFHKKDGSKNRYWKSNCKTCAVARRLLQYLGIPVYEIQPPDEEEEELVDDPGYDPRPKGEVDGGQKTQLEASFGPDDGVPF